MSAELLRKAASMLREQAKGATPGPWNTDGPFWVDPPGKPISEMTVEARAGVTAGAERRLVMAGTWDSRSEDATYIATMHPGVGLALADWLVSEAVQAEEGWVIGPDYPSMRLARLIVGGDA